MYRNILLAYDGSRDSREALEQGARLAAMCGARVRLLTVIDLASVMIPAEGISFVDERAILESNTTLAEGRTQLREWGIQGQVDLRYGDPAEQISASAREIGADLVVVGHRNHSTIWRWLNGSVGAAVLKAASCSVLVAIDPAQVH